VKIKQRPEDFVVREGSSYEADRDGPVWVYRMDKQKISTLQALERIGKEFGVRRRALSVCGLKDKQGRTEQLIGVEGGALGLTEVVQSGDMRLQLVGRAAKPLTSANVTANRFEVTVRDLTREEADRIPESAKEVEKVGIVNYFDSQRFGFLKHGQGFIGKQLIRGDFEGALKSFLATPSKLDRSDDAKVKEFWRENWGDWRKFAPQKAGALYAPILRVLRTNPDDFKGAFMHIERRTRMMTLFELQSYLWNEGVRKYLISVLPPACATRRARSSFPARSRFRCGRRWRTRPSRSSRTTRPSPIRWSRRQRSPRCSRKDLRSRTCGCRTRSSSSSSTRSGR
jgi:tRNA pseudouridine13 synthase